MQAMNFVRCPYLGIIRFRKLMPVVHPGRFSQLVAPLRYRRFYEQRTRDSLFECAPAEACSPIFTGLPTKRRSLLFRTLSGLE